MGGNMGLRLSAAAATLLAAAAAFAQAAFPFDRELLLDARPLPGSRRIPILEIGADGRAQIDLWCRSGAGQVVVSGTTIKITLGPLREEACTPERARRDEEMAAALSEVTRWRTDGDRVVLVGPTEIRFFLSAH
jgi:heat shock protein HslJ